MYNPMVCDHCGRELPPGTTKYIVDLILFADFDGYMEDEEDVEGKIRNLLNEVEKMDQKRLEEDVYEEYTLILCRGCRDRLRRKLLSNFETKSEMERKETLH